MPIMKLLVRTITLSILVLLSSGIVAQTTPADEHPKYKPDNQGLYDTIAYLDSVFFAAYNTCNMDVQADFYNENIEFYHDQSGLMTSKQEILESIKLYICGKVTRELVKGSIEVYPIGSYGAVEIGLHKFHNNQQPEGTQTNTGKFIIIWQNDGGKWTVVRVVSIH